MTHTEFETEVTPYLNMTSLSAYWETQHGHELDDDGEFPAEFYEQERPEDALIEEIIALQIAWRILWHSAGPCQSIPEHIHGMVTERLKQLDLLMGPEFSLKINPNYDI